MDCISFERGKAEVRGWKLEIRKKLRGKPAKEMDRTLESPCKGNGRGWRLEGEEKKGLTRRRRGPKKVLLVRMNPLARTASGALGTSDRNSAVEVQSPIIERPG
jgi:hypothetical protein